MAATSVQQPSGADGDRLAVSPAPLCSLIHQVVVAHP